MWYIEPSTSTSCSASDPAIYSTVLLSDNDKIAILNHKQVYCSGFTFPMKFGRNYCPHWANEYKWLQYSISEDAAYCIYCILFGGDNWSKRGVHFVPFHHAGFTDWKNAKGVKRGEILNHESSEAHKIATTKAK